MTERKKLTWQSIVDNKKSYIGGKLVEEDAHCGTAHTVIKDIRLEPHGKDSQMIHVDGEDWNMCCAVSCGAIMPRDHGARITAMFGTRWQLHKKEADSG